MRSNTLSTIAMLWIFFSACHGQKTADEHSTIDGRSFLIESFSPDGNSIGKEMIYFKNGTIEGSKCNEYGYDKPKYTVDKDGKIRARMQSQEEGILQWTGEIVNNQFQGEALWIKKGQDDIIISFIGPEQK